MAPPPRDSNTVAWVFVGTGIAAVAGGGVLLGLAELDIQEHDDLESPGDDAKRDKLERSANEKRIIGGIIGGVGVAVGVTGIVMLLTDDDEAPKSSWRVRPGFGAGSVGVDFEMGF